MVCFAFPEVTLSPPNISQGSSQITLHNLISCKHAADMSADFAGNCMGVLELMDIPSFNIALAFIIASANFVQLMPNSLMLMKYFFKIHDETFLLF